MRERARQRIEQIRSVRRKRKKESEREEREREKGPALPVSLSFSRSRRSRPSLRVGKAAAFRVCPEVVAAGCVFSTTPVRGPAFCSLPRHVFPFSWAGQCGFWGVSAGTAAAQCVISSMLAEKKGNDSHYVISTLCPQRQHLSHVLPL